MMLAPRAYLLRPDLFSFKSVSVQVETASVLTRGHTGCGFLAEDRQASHCELGDRCGRGRIFRSDDRLYRRL